MIKKNSKETGKSQEGTKINILCKMISFHVMDNPLSYGDSNQFQDFHQYSMWFTKQKPHEQ